MEQKWCEHSRIQSDGAVEVNYWPGKYWVSSNTGVQFCPICGAKRPEPVKSNISAITVMRFRDSLRTVLHFLVMAKSESGLLKARWKLVLLIGSSRA